MSILTQTLGAKPTKNNIRKILAITKKKQFKSIREDIVRRRRSAIKKALKENSDFTRAVNNAVVK